MNDGGAQRVMDWAALLARWMDFAKAATVVPPAGEGARWRGSVAAAIELHAVACALGEIALVDPADRPVAVARAAVVIGRAEAVLEDAWSGAELPESLRLLRQDARAALDAARAESAV